MNQTLVIVFAKNKLLGKVKTRLAKDVGDANALKVYERLLAITENATADIDNMDLHIYYSHEIDKTSWVGHTEKYVQSGDSLGERMWNAFSKGFEDGYQSIIGIGADLDHMDEQTLQSAKDKLSKKDFVFGPAMDGGYYLVGLNGVKGAYVFQNKPWSTSKLLELTLSEIDLNGHQYELMDKRNDIDLIDDLRQSTLAKEFTEIL